MRSVPENETSKPAFCQEPDCANGTRHTLELRPNRDARSVVSAWLAKSTELRDLVYEAYRGRTVVFVNDVDELDHRLGQQVTG